MSDLMRRGGAARLGLASSGALLLMLLGTPGRADLVFFKDGFVLQGRVMQPRKIEVDPETKVAIEIPTGNLYLDDGPRLILFSPKFVGIAEKKSAGDEIRVINRNGVASLTVTMPPVEAIVEIGDWDLPKWERMITYQSSGTRGVIKVPQRAMAVTPYFTWLAATRNFKWMSFYLTRELGPEQVRGLLSNHPDFQLKAGLSTAEKASRCFKYCDFFAQCGWFEEAERELNRIQQDFPDYKKQSEAALEAINHMRTRDRCEEIKRLHGAGQLEGANKLMASLAEKFADEQMLGEVRLLRSDYVSLKEKLALARRYLDELPRLMAEDDVRRKQFTDVAAVLRTELAPETLPRLDAFMGQAAQAERRRKAGQSNDLGPAELLSLAATGWLLGSPSAESKPARALQLWKARELVLTYLRETNSATREKLLDDYLSGKVTVPVDEFAQLIPQLPPAEAEAKLSSEPMERSVGSNGKGPSYLLQLPPEYRHSRSYPVLIALHGAGESPASVVKRWSEAAADNGYILMAPYWEVGNNGYQYSEAEHDSVVLSLRDLRQHFSVDSDRVFLFGLGQGGTMAFDVGLSHPDLFAGVMPMSASPEYFAMSYMRNGQYLPFYVVGGNVAGESHKKTSNLFNGWISHNYPSLWIQYKGRGIDWFSGEVPNMIDWMRKKKRAFPLQQLGTEGSGGLGDEFCTMRPTDNHFYWLSSSNISPRCYNTALGWNNKVAPATLTAKISLEQNSNDINIHASGMRQLTVWFGRDSRGVNMIDFDKPLTVRVNLQIKINGRKAPPSLATMLEDLYQRGDRQLLFLSKVEMSW